MNKNQRGNLIAAAAILIAGVGSFGVTVIRTLTQTSVSSTKVLQFHRSFSLAESAFEYAALQIKNNIDVNNPTTYCNGAWKATQNFGEGQFRFKCTQYSPSTTTKAAVSSSAATIPVTSLANMAPIGRVQIDSEKIDYASTSTDAAICGTTPCLVVRKRGAANTTAASHSNGAAVTQTQLVVETEGGDPDLTTPDAKVTLQHAITATWLSYTNAWAVGNNGAVYRLVNGKQWQYVSVSPTTTKDFRGVACTSASNCWAVGTSSTVYRWDGTSWTEYTADSYGSGSPDLLAVACTSANDCWLLTEKKDIYRWNGSNWSFNQGYSKNLNDISCAASNLCIVAANSGNIYKWNGSSWSTMSTPTTKDLDGVSCPDTNNCFAVGASGTIIKMSGSTWSTQTSPLSNPWTDVSCPDANNCWTFGNSRDRNAQYQNNSWATKTVSITDNTIRNVYCVSYEDCYVAANRINSSYALIGKWNGVTWRNADVLSGSAQNLYAVTADKQQSNVVVVRDIGWREVFN